jgi:ATP-dependent helicase HrpA
MAFEMVETAQVYFRTLAKIEPEWILLAAGELLKYHYFEPHWSKKTGLVHAYAQISLFGLIIQPKQLQNFEKVDQAAAHEIFLRDALVTGQLGTQPAFLQHNLKQLQEIERVEDKLRRRDLIVDEETLYQFYAARIPAEIASRRSFEDWRATIEPQQPQLLYFSEQDIWQNQRPDTELFPDYLENGSLKLAVSYRFDPSHDEDGATVKIPIQALSQVDRKLWSWGILGWRQEFIEALLKNLPKDKRRLLVPIPNTVQQLLKQIEPQHTQQHIFAILGFLLRGHGMSAQDFSVEALPNYLLPLIKVFDAQQQLVAQGRDLEALQLRCRGQITRPVIHHTGQLKQFPPEFVFNSTQQIAGVQVQNYQALTPIKAFAELESLDQAAVQLQQFHDLAQAEQQHRLGLLQLIYLQLGDAVRQLKKQISKPLAMAFSPLGDKAQLEKIIIYASLVLTTQGQQAQSAAAFEALVQHSKQHFLSHGLQALAVISEIYMLWQAIRQSLLSLDLVVFKRSINDIEDQLDLMQLQQFVYSQAAEIWLDYPRYLKALQLRLARLPNNLQRDEAAINSLDPWMDKLFKFPQAQNTSVYGMVEELRISLFAQPMKTKYAISPARLDKAWAAIDLSKN